MSEPKPLHEAINAKASSTWAYTAGWGIRFSVRFFVAKKVCYYPSIVPQIFEKIYRSAPAIHKKGIKK